LSFIGVDVLGISDKNDTEDCTWDIKIVFELEFSEINSLT
jgi:hypothetical protein